MSPELKKQIENIVGRYFFIIIIAAMLLVFLLGYLFLVLPTQRTAASGDIYQASENEYLSLKRQLAELNELTKIYQSIDPKDIDKIEKFLPPKARIEELMKQMEVIVLQNGFFLTDLQISDESGQDIGSVNISMGIVGPNYAGFKNLLYALESNLRLLDIKQISFDPAGRSAAISLVAYYQI